MRAPGIRLQLASAVKVQCAGHAARDLAPLDAALLAWLALEGPTPRARLAQLLWPDKNNEAARNSLRQRLFKLRRDLGIELVAGVGTLSLAPGVAHDLDDADRVLGESPGEDIAPGEFAQWLDAQRARCRDRARRALVEHAERAESAGDWAGAIARAHELLGIEPLSEDAHRRLMRLHYLAGDRAAALLAFDACERVLKDEVGTRPSTRTLELLAMIEQADAQTPAGARSGVPVQVMRPPRLVGREKAWAAMQAAWASERVTLVVGDAGLGKTRLVTDFAASVGRTLVVGARPGDAQVVYATLSRLLRGLPAAARAALPESVRGELARVLPELGASRPLVGDEGRTRFFNAVAAALQSPERSFDGIVLDDLHFADDASIELLQYVAASGSARWIVCARPAEVTASGRSLIAGFEAHAPVLRVALQPLSKPQVQQLLESLALPELAGDAAAELAATLWRRTGGNPMYVLESLKALLLQPAPQPGSPLPALRPWPHTPDISALIERRIGQLSVPAVQLARCAAVAAPDFSIDLAAHVLGLRTLDLADPWAELEAAQVLRDGAFAHDLIYESALASVPGPVARRLHGEIAAFLEAHGGEPARVAAHWLQAGAEAQALDAMASAATRADTALRQREAADWHRRAADLAERLGQRERAFEHWVGVFDANMVVDRAAVDDAFFDRMARLAHTPMQRLRTLLARGDHAKDSSRFDDGLRWCEQAAAEARALGRRDLEVDALRGAAGNAAFGGDPARAIQLLRPLVPWVMENGAVGDQQSLFNDLAACLDMCDQPQEAREYHARAIRLAVEAGRLDQAAIACSNLAYSLRSVGRTQAAFEQAQQARLYVAGYDDARSKLYALDVMVPSMLRDLGRYGEAVQMGEAAVLAMPHNPNATLAAQGHLLWLWIVLGQHARARRLLATMQSTPLMPHTRARVAQLEGRLERSMGRDAAPALARAMADAPRAGRAVVQTMIALDHALVLEPREALAQCRQVEQRAATLGLDGVRLAARVRACAAARAAADVPAAVALAREVLSAPDDITPDDLYRGEAWLSAAQAFDAAGEDDDARRVVAEGARWVRETAATRVPAEFRDSFLNRNPVNRELLALASQLRLR